MKNSAHQWIIWHMLGMFLSAWCGSGNSWGGWTGRMPTGACWISKLTGTVIHKITCWWFLGFTYSCSKIHTWQHVQSHFSKLEQQSEAASQQQQTLMDEHYRPWYGHIYRICHKCGSLKVNEDREEMCMHAYTQHVHVCTNTCTHSYYRCFKSEDNPWFKTFFNKTVVHPFATFTQPEAK